MNLQVDVERILLAHKAVRAELLAERAPGGYWVGQLASSPAATAAAISALVVAHQQDTGSTLRETLAADGQVLEQLVQSDLSELLLESVHWLARHQNPDGGWGDCDTAHSNLAATLLVQSAFRLTGVPAKYADLIARADQYITSHGGPGGLRRSHADNKALVNAVLANAALAGIASWRHVPASAFELLRLPKRWKAYVQLPYPKHATAAMLAVGLAKFHHYPPRNPFTRLVRRSLRAKSLEWLARLQAEDDSFLGSSLLTAFVVMNVASIGCQRHTIVQRGVEYLLATVRGDSSWPVKTDIATRNTALALQSLSDSQTLRDQKTPVAYERLPGGISATSPDAAWLQIASAEETVADRVQSTRNARLLAHASEQQPGGADDPFNEQCLDWLLTCQRRKLDQNTEIGAGGWGWSDQPGAVPNADDTANALIALAHWTGRSTDLQRQRIEQAARRGIAWLLDLQNDDGGWATFYRDESTFRVEVSAADVTAHVLRALAAWRERFAVRNERSFTELMTAAIERGWTYLEAEQRDDGSFIPLWYGNERHQNQHNPVYGTAEALLTSDALGRLHTTLAQRAASWLVSAQHTGGGWGPPRLLVHYSAVENDGFRARRTNEAMSKLCSVEESALAVSALLPLVEESDSYARAVSNGLSWLAAAVEQDAHRRPAVIGFYPSRLSYHERLYPLLFAAGALSQAVRQLALEPRIAAPVG
jgi:squalene-hopene/tetraprenyl-beta-curcumene cyclase